MGIMFRYEHDDGKGPYTSQTPSIGDMYWEMIGIIEGHSGLNGHPGPWEDKLPDPWINTQNRYGLPSVKALFQWFEKVNDNLLKLGFKIIKIESNRIKYGNTQCCISQWADQKKTDVTAQVTQCLMENKNYDDVFGTNEVR